MNILLLSRIINYIRNNETEIKYVLKDALFGMRVLTPNTKKNYNGAGNAKHGYFVDKVKINNFKSLNFNYEKLWREDNAYDIVIVISHNIKPVIKNKGSAIFLHCSFFDKRDTSGCIALKKRDLIFAINNMKNNTCLRI